MSFKSFNLSSWRTTSELLCRSNLTPYGILVKRSELTEYVRYRTFLVWINAEFYFAQNFRFLWLFDSWVGSLPKLLWMRFPFWTGTLTITISLSRIKSSWSSPRNSRWDASDIQWQISFQTGWYWSYSFYNADETFVVAFNTSFSSSIFDVLSDFEPTSRINLLPWTVTKNANLDTSLL